MFNAPPVMRIVIFEGTTRRGMNLKDSNWNMKMLKKGEMVVVCDVVKMQQSFCSVVICIGSEIICVKICCKIKRWIGREFDVFVQKIN